MGILFIHDLTGVSPIWYLIAGSLFIFMTFCLFIFYLTSNEQLWVTQERQKSSQIDKTENSDADTCLVLDEHPTVPEITSQKNPSPVSPAICGSVVHPCYGEASEECRRESPDHHLLTQVSRSRLYVVIFYVLFSIL